MRIRIIGILFMGIALVLGACANAQRTPVSPPPTPIPTQSTVFVTSNLTIVPDAIRPGSSSTIGVTVTNTGQQPDTYIVALNVDGDITETQHITLAGGASQAVTFIFTTFNERDYVITIDQLKGILQVLNGV